MQNLNLKRTLIMTLLILSIMATAFYVGLSQQRDVQISYISQSEILEMETARVQTQDLNNRQLFFGKPEQAIKIIESIQRLESTGNNIILLSEDKLYGKGVKSISKAVHARILKELKKD